MSVLLAWISVCRVCAMMPKETLELELLTVASCHVGAESQT